MIGKKFFDAAVVLLMVLGLVTIPGQSAIAHAELPAFSAELEPHSAPLDYQIDDHGHHHDDEDSPGNACGALHGHDATDHSHQVAFAEPAPEEHNVKTPGRWNRASVCLPKFVRAYQIDRPPQVSLSA